MANLNNFYLNTIETLVFESSQPQQEQAQEENMRTPASVIETIMTTITDGFVRHDLSAGVPIQPYYRMIIIQLLFRHHDTHVARFLKKWFDNVNDPSLAGLFASAKNIAIFYVGCVQEHYALLLNEITVADSIAVELLTASSVAATVCARDASFSVERLTYVAKLKFVLKVLAKCVSSQEAFERCTRRLAESSVFQSLLKRVQQLLAPSLDNTHVVFNYLVKELIRKFGNDSVKFIMANESIKWMGNFSLITSFSYLQQKKNF